MDISINRTYELQNFSLGSLKLTYDRVRKLCKGKGWKSEITKSVSDGEVSSSQKIPSSDLHDIVSFTSGVEGLKISLHKIKESTGFIDNEKTIYIAFDNWRGENELNIHVSAEDAPLCKKICEIFEQELNLRDKSREVTIPVKPPALLDEPPQKSKLQPSKQKSPLPSNQLEPPSKVTLSWLWEHVPMPLWFWTLAILLTVFGIGLRLGEYKWISKLLETISP